MSNAALARAVSFDAAGTLIGVARPVAETYAAIAAQFAIDLEPDALDAAFRAQFPRMTPLAFGPCNEAALQRQERQWWMVLVRRCLDDQGRHPRFGEFFHGLYEYYRGCDAWCLYPEVEEVLAILSRHRVPLVVTSNFDSRLVDILDGHGVRDAFKAVIYSSAAGSAKPDRGIFAASCQALALAGSEVLHVGDDPTADLHGARDAGLQARRVCRDRQPGHDEIPDLHHVLALVSGVADG